MKTKNAIKLIKSVCDLFGLVIELEKRQAERLVNTPIPEYKKWSDSFMQKSKDYHESLKNLIFTTEQFSNECNNSLDSYLKSKGLKRDRTNPKKSTFSEAFEKVKLEDPVLKKSYEDIEKSMPFAHPLSEEIKVYDHYLQKSIDFRNKLVEKPKEEMINHDFILDDIRKACELGDIERVILMSEKLKTSK